MHHHRNLCTMPKIIHYLNAKRSSKCRASGGHPEQSHKTTISQRSAFVMAHMVKQPEVFYLSSDINFTFVDNCELAVIGLED